MGIAELLFLAVGLAMDAFAVSIGKGVSIRRTDLRKPLIIGLYFGLFQAGMPLIGFFAGRSFSGFITAFDHWVVFILLGFIGARMIYEGMVEKREKDEGKEKGEGEGTGGNIGETDGASVRPRIMLPLAVATSIDALAVGISFALLPPDVGLPAAVAIIGVTTLLISLLGAKLGGAIGGALKSKAEAFGGAILILVGVKILIEHIFS